MNKIDVMDFDGASRPAATKPDMQPFAPAPTLDPEEYRADLASLDLSEEQETEFLETLWSIMGHFARMGFSVDVCGLIFEEFNEASALAPGDGKLASSIKEETPAEQGQGGNT